MKTLEDGTAASTSSVRVCKYRWIVLLVFCLYSVINFSQVVQYSIISNITAKYYDVNGTLAVLTSLVFMACFIVLCLPINHIIEKYNLRITAIISSGLTTCGNLIKLLSVARDRFYVVMIGQFLCAIAQVFIISVPSKLASTWFGPEEVSTACAIAILGMQIGVAFGSVLPSNLVRNSDDMDAIGADFLILMIINASLTTLVFVLVLLFFRGRPKIPPSQSQVNIVDTEKLSIWSSVKAMAKYKNYLLLLVAFGSSNGILPYFGIMLNRVYLHYFPGYEAEVGVISALAVLAGGTGCVMFGYILDKWHHFKITSFFIILAAAIAYIIVVLSMELKSQLATYFTIPLFGFFLASTLLVGFEFATEIMYPVPEAASCAILNSFIGLFIIMYTLLFGTLFHRIGFIATHSVIAGLLVLSSLSLYFISPTLRRREINMQK